jgi:hypothetical protein
LPAALRAGEVAPGAARHCLRRHGAARAGRGMRRGLIFYRATI